jgi:glycosyltransferase involved in cell wall biosynthesis
MSTTSPTDSGMPTTAPRISVVMPVYNAERLLGECLAAVNASTFRDYEIVVVDDSSTDGSREIAAEHGARVVPSGGRLGPGRARNKGVEHARGDFVFFIDSDVVIRPETLGRLVAAFDRDPGVAGLMAVQSPTMRFRNLCSVYKNLWMYYTYVRRAGQDVPLFYTTAAAIRRTAFVASGGFDANYVDPNIEDTDYGQKLASQGFRVQILPDLEVEHVKGYDLRGLLRVDFLRSMSLARLKLRKSADGIGTNDTSVPTGYIVSVPLAGIALLLLLGGLTLGNRTLLLANFLALATILVLNVPFLRLIRAHGGVRAGGLSCGLLIIELLAAGAGSAVGIATYLGGKKY